MTTLELLITAVVLTLVKAVLLGCVIGLLVVLLAVVLIALHGGPLVLWPDDVEDWTP